MKINAYILNCFDEDLLDLGGGYSSEMLNELNIPRELIDARIAAWKQPSWNPLTETLRAIRLLRLVRLLLAVRLCAELRGVELSLRHDHEVEQAEARVREGVAWLRRSRC